MNTIPTRRQLILFMLVCASVTLAAGCSVAAPTAVPPTAISQAASPTPAPAQASAQTAYWPTRGWRTSTPEEQGMDPQKLAAMLEDVKQKKLNLHSLLVIRGGYIVSETYFRSYDQNSQHEIYSCTKSFISTLVGIAIDKGYISSINLPVVDSFPGRTFENMDARKQTMTLENLLTMTSGLAWDDDDATIGRLYRSADWVKFVLDTPMTVPPGTKFNYCSGCSHVMSALLQQRTEIKTREFAQQVLFEPLGISNANWNTDSTGIPIGGWGLQIAARDMAKLGFLYLHDGIWDGQQIVSSGWVDAATQQHTGTDTDLGYGYQWWTYPSLHAYTALGRYGQTIFVSPDLDLIVVTTAMLDNHDEIFRLIEDYIVPAAQKS